MFSLILGVTLVLKQQILTPKKEMLIVFNLIMLIEN